MIAETKKKVQMVNELSQILHKYVRGVQEVSYKVFTDSPEAFRKDEKCFKREYAVVEFVGGAKCVRNCTGDSLSCIIEEISKMLDGGYYEELPAYTRLATDSSVTEVSAGLLL